MPAFPTATSAQRTIHVRRTRLRRGAAGSATAEGTRSSGDSAGKAEEGEVTAGLASSNRFSVLRSKEPAPGATGEALSTVPLDPILRRERLVTITPQTKTPPTEQPPQSEGIRDGSPAPSTPLATFCPKRRSIHRLAPRPFSSPSLSSPPISPNLLPSPPVLASPPSPPTTPTPFASPRLASIPSPSVPRNPLPPNPPVMASLPFPPIPPDPLLDPGLATLPIHPSLDFRSVTSIRSSGPKPHQFAPPMPTTFAMFPSHDPMRQVVQTARGKVFSIAAEIAAANTKSSTRPVGNVLIPRPAKISGAVRGKIRRRKSDRRKEWYNKSSEEMEDESEEEAGEEDGWLGKDEGFWKRPFERET